MRQNLALLCDFYEFTMSAGYFSSGFEDKICYFDVFFRKVPDGGAFAIFAGLEDILDFVESLRFEGEDIDFLRKQGIFSEDFLKFLSDFKFNGEIHALREGEVIFPNEPLISIKASAIEAQLLETFLLLSINHQSLIATKANRITRAAAGRPVLEFGARRAHGSEAALKGARSALIGGCAATSNTLAAKLYAAKASGTMAHSWVQMFGDEFSAFCAYLKLYPKNPILLIDTYDCLAGLENAMRAFREFGIKEAGVRIDSGDLKTLSIKIRKRLDEEGFEACKIIASNGLDEFEIHRLLEQGAKIDAFGVGERLITASSDAVFGCVYKLVASEQDGTITPKIKISENSTKTTIPHFKRLFRIYDRNSGKALYDELIIHDEPLDELDANLRREELLRPVFKDGKRQLERPSLEELRDFSKGRVASLDEGLLDLKPSKSYELVLSERLKALRDELTSRHVKIRS
ncbi:nicotinate phosphoribosyltransferase [Campylobacter sp.]|uniref:nicotinate phosphoribosyltransferase n=1 Tax=Campylobacter sp. TaxID=205 RepID=UPI0026DDC557|nr:nicotinate phosphoribosyltransferase [Campylobacter sp.]MDO4674629.1 nicotinate phosphoribosyltransferase [Campylobacter sp.]